MTLIPSPLPYDEGTRSALADALCPLVVDLLDLAASARVAHWTVRGPYTQALHLLFGSFYVALSDQADTLAEYVRLLGAQAPGTAQDVAEGTRLDPYDPAIVDGIAHCKALSERSAVFLAFAQESVNACNDAGASDALDLVTTLIEAVSKPAGFIGDHLYAG